MDLSLENSTFTEVDIGNSVESFQRFLESQKQLFHSQVDHLEKIVAAQCRLTGVNPLAQEMAAGALSIKIGKRPRDLLNPKAVKYMQSIFSIKDTITKKEIREISAFCGVTITQVREFFAGQRSRVRKHARLSRERATALNTSNMRNEVCCIKSDVDVPVALDAPLNPVEDQKLKDADSSSLIQEETLPGLESTDKHFVDNIFASMEKEAAFSGQMKLMEWILQIHNLRVLNWFLTKGGITILSSWLSEAALEEQTTLLLIILKVLCHLPLHKALPVQMSSILQTVNRLRFYRTPDVSNRAKVLLSRWSKLFVRSHGLKKVSPATSPVDAQKELIRKQRISEILSNESWKSKLEIPEEFLSVTDNGVETTRLEQAGEMKLPPSTPSDSNKRSIRNISSSYNRERRKVLLVEQPTRTAARSVPAARSASINQSRPMSVDDIQKAKMRATFMQSKHGKTVEDSKENKEQKTENSNTRPGGTTASSETKNQSLLDPETSSLKGTEDLKPVQACTSGTMTPMKYALKPQPSHLREQPDLSNTFRQNTDSGQKSYSEKLPWEKLKKHQTKWRTPPEMKIDPAWTLGAGEKSKEIEVQTERIRREKETIYHSNQDIPSDPKEPWDMEMDYDDSLTPEIPSEQIPDPDSAGPSSPRETVAASASTSAIGHSKTPEPDLELLAVLLKNPDLVFALTSGQANNISNGQLVQVLDMLKASGIGQSASVNVPVGDEAEIKKSGLPHVPVSLPSPTPTPHPSPPPLLSDPLARWRLESAPTPKDSGAAHISQPVTPGILPPSGPTPSLDTVQPNQGHHRAVSSMTASHLQLPPLPERALLTSAPPATPSPWPQVISAAPARRQLPPAEVTLPLKHIPAPINHPVQNAPPTTQQFPVAPFRGPNVNVNSAHASLLVNNISMEKPTTTSYSAYESTPSRPQQPPLPEQLSHPPAFPSWKKSSLELNMSTQVSLLPPFVEKRGTIPHVIANQNDYHNYPPSRAAPPPLQPEYERWSPDRGRHEADRNSSMRRDAAGWSHDRSKWSRSRNSEHHSGSRSSRWRERDRRY